MVGSLVVHTIVVRLARYLSTDGFTAVPGYSGGLRLKDPGYFEVVARMDGTGRVVLRYRLWLESGGCNHDPPLGYNSSAACNVAISVANSCSDLQLLGVHHWNHSKVEHDPWLAVKYVGDMDDPSLRGTRTIRHLVVGLGFSEMYGHAVVLRDAEGVPAACGLLEREWTSVRFFNHHAVIILASIAAFGSLIFTVILSIRHCKCNLHRALRRYTVRILLMVPIFSMEALAALALHLSALNAEILKLIREVYEAIVIFSFLQFIIVCVGGPKRLVARFTPAEGSSPREPLRPCFPWNYCLPPWRSAELMLRCCIFGTMSYVVVGLVVAVISFTLAVIIQVPDSFVEGWLKVSRVLIGLAQFAAITSLVELAEKNMQELRPLRPLGKFLSVKIVVFFTFWQSLIIGHLVHKGIFVDFFDNQEKWGTEQAVGEGVLDVIVVLEMFVVSISHLFIFPPRDYELLETETEQHPPGWSRAKSTFVDQTLDIFSPSDVLATVCPGCVQSMGWGARQRYQGGERSWFTSDGRRQTVLFGLGNPLQRVCAEVEEGDEDPSGSTSSEDDEDENEDEDDQDSGSASEELRQPEQRRVTFSSSPQSPCV